MSKTPSLAADLAVTLKIVQSEIKTLRDKAAKEVRRKIKLIHKNPEAEIVDGANEEVEA